MSDEWAQLYYLLLILEVRLFEVL